MPTLKQIAGKLRKIPSSTAWYLADISEFKGKQDAPQSNALSYCCRFSNSIVEGAHKTQR